VFPGQGFESRYRERERERERGRERGRERERERGKEENFGSCFTDALNKNGNVQKYEK
jgi:hypothetical protein